MTNGTELQQFILPPQLLTLMDTINYIGSSHNLVLDSLLCQMENLKNGNISLTNQQSEESYIISFIDNFYQLSGFNCSAYIDTSSLDLTHEITMDELTGSNSNLSSQAVILIDSMNLFFEDYIQNMDLNLFISKCNQIISQSLNLSSYYERIICASGASVAKNSAIYWSDTSKISRFEGLMITNRINKNIDNPELQMTA